MVKIFVLFFHLFSLCKLNTIFSIKWLILHFKITQFKYAEHGPLPTDLGRGVLFLSPHCRHRKLRTNCRDTANSSGKRFCYQTPSPKPKSFSSQSPVGQGQISVQFLSLTQITASSQPSCTIIIKQNYVSNKENRG